MKSNSYIRNSYLTLLAYFVIQSNPFGPTSTIAQDFSPPQRSFQYYLQLHNDEFLKTMIPKEQFLLGIVKNVNEEISRRRSEGSELADLGIHQALDPDEVFMTEYAQELEMVVDLLDEINQLERTARKQVNFQILDALSDLKDRVREIIEKDNLTLNLSKSQEGQGDSLLRIDPTVDIKVDSEENQLNEEYEEEVRLDDLYEQWKYNRILEYKVKLTEYEFFRIRLLSTASETQEMRMFQRDLKRALLSYSDGNFHLSRIQLRDVLDTYSRYRLLDDILYYLCESSYGCNYLDEALEGYQRLVSEYPESPYTAKGLVKLIYIYFIYGQYEKLYDLHQQIMLRKEQLENVSVGTVSYLVAYTQFKAGNYESALDLLGKIEPGVTYFYPSIYLSAACYSNIGKDDLALSLYHRLVEVKRRGKKNPILAQIKNNALLKLGLMYYEKGDPDQATSYFNQVTEDFQYYDLSMIGKAWSAFSSGKPGEALQNAEWLLEHSMISSYAYEAKVLAASSKNLLGHSEEAIQDLKQVFQTGKRADRMEQMPASRETMTRNIQQIEEFQQQLKKDRDRVILDVITEIRRFLMSSASDLETWETSQNETNYNFTNTMQILTEKIEILDRLEEQARGSDTNALLGEIRSLRSDLIDTLNDHRFQASETTPDPEEDPLIRRMGMTDYLKYVFRSLLVQTLREKEQTRKDIQEAGALLTEAREGDNFNLSIRMEIAQEEFQDYHDKLNQHEVWLRENSPQEFRIELDQWATFSGYGISNISFSRIKESDRQIGRISNTIDVIDYVFNAKRGDLENRIQGLLSDVAKIEDQMMKEASKKDQMEKERFFKTEYFNRQRQESVTGKLREKSDSKKKVKK